MPHVLFYTQPGCPACVTAKEFLSARGISFEERNIRSDPEYLRELVENHQSRATPTLVLGDKVLIGFDPEEYLATLGALDD